MNFDAIFIARLLAFGSLFLVGLLAVAIMHSFGIPAWLDSWCWRHRRIVNFLKAIALIAFVAYVSAFAVLRHYSLETSILDLGNVEQTFWNTIHGQPFRLTTDSSPLSLPDSRLAYHIEPIILPLSLFYWLLPRTETLLLLQVVVVGLSALLVAKIAEKKLQSPFAGLVFLLAYLLAEPVRNGLTFDIHPVVFALPAFLLAYWFFTNGQYGRSVLAGITLMFSREDAAVLALFFGVFLLAHRRSRLAGFLLTVSATAWLAVLAAIFTHFHPGGYEYLWRLQGFADASGVPSTLQAFLLAPGRLQYLVWLVAPLAFLPLAGLPTALLAAVSAGIVVVGGSPRELLGELHYHLMGYGVFIVAAISGARVLGQRLWRGRQPATLSFAVLTMTLVTTAVFGLQARLPRPEWGRLQALREAAAAIPVAASVAASANAGPWVDRRADLYLLISPRRTIARYTLALACATDVCDNLPKKEYDALLDEVGADPFNRLVFRRDGVLLYQRQTDLSVRPNP